MERIKRLGRYQKWILIGMTVMVLVFAVLYPVTLRRVGFAYQGAILVPRVENGKTVYSGKLRGEPARFTVSEDKTVVFQYGSRTYGPYTVKEDPSAIPQGEEMADRMTGVELREGETILFRGGVVETGGDLWLFKEDGTLENTEIVYWNGSGTGMDQNGKAVSTVKPSAAVLLKLMRGPQLTHKGTGLAWFGGVFLCGVNAVRILFADELFRWDLAFRIRSAEDAEPSELELAGRYIAWTVLPLAALAVFVIGLR